ncbi:MAG: DUF2125 domain-containing protein [Hyphomicrobiales bacterium]
MTYRHNDDFQPGYRPLPPYPPEYYRPRRRVGKYIAMLVIVLALAGAWSGLWYYAAAVTADTIAGWRDREAKVGRIHSCGMQSIDGFPFRVEVRCDKAGLELRSNQPPLDIKTAGILIAAQIYQPTLLISEFTGPLTVGEAGRPPNIVANWELGQTSVRGTPKAPERVSIVLDSPTLDRMDAGAAQQMVKAKRIEIHGRMAEGSATDNPVIEIVLRLAAASLPAVHPLAVAPIDSDVTAVLRGMKDFSPKPWPVRFREMQAAGGRIDITQARIAQGETVAVGKGALSLNARGGLEGQILVTVAGLEPFLKTLGVEQIAPATPAVDKLVGALDRFAPGLGAAARQQAGAGIVAGIGLLGEKTILEGRQAVSLPLRFNDGAMSLGPIPIGRVAALF